jgi:hypothetical protein
MPEIVKGCQMPAFSVWLYGCSNTASCDFGFAEII